MTREEAIAFFKDMNECTYGNLEAVEMAIEALEQEPCKREIEREYLFQSLCEDFKKLQAENDDLRKRLEQEPCEDAVSRQALLEEIENGIKAGNYEEGYEKYSHINDMDDIIECIKYADSIQPKPKTIQEIQAESEKYQKAFEDGYEQGYAQARFDYEQEPCEDAINRQAVLDCLTATGLKKYDFILNARDKIKNLQSVKPQEPKWIPVSERLPEIHQDVLLSLRSLDIEVGFRAETEPYFYCHGDYIEPQNVLAWMPLPQSYEPKGVIE